jgi:hypothetical protein
MAQNWAGYVVALRRCDHRPGDRIAAECPGCARPFAVEMPRQGGFVPIVHGGEVQLSCPFACGRSGTNLLSTFLVGGAPVAGTPRTCPYCGIATSTLDEPVLCPVCAGYA